jgi:hypothetical protein
MLCPRVFVRAYTIVLVILFVGCLPPGSEETCPLGSTRHGSKCSVPAPDLRLLSDHGGAAHAAGASSASSGRGGGGGAGRMAAASGHRSSSIVASGIAGNGSRLPNMLTGVRAGRTGSAAGAPNSAEDAVDGGAP